LWLKAVHKNRAQNNSFKETMVIFKLQSARKLIAIPAALALLLASCGDKPAAPAASVVLSPTKDTQQQMTPDQVLQMLKEGNARFTTDHTVDRDHKADVAQTGKQGQYPFASVLSCIDSRSPPSLVFDRGVGDLFVASVAGNIVNPDILGSLEYASKVAGSKLVVVLGHTHCGAVKGACDKVELGNITQLLGKITPAVDMTPNTHGADRSSKNHHFVDAVAHNSVKLTVKQILDKSPVLRAMSEKGEIKIVAAMLDVETGKIEFYDK
jgi:carbonic anhydrase